MKLGKKKLWSGAAEERDNKKQHWLEMVAFPRPSIEYNDTTPFAWISEVAQLKTYWSKLFVTKIITSPPKRGATIFSTIDR